MSSASTAPHAISAADQRTATPSNTSRTAPGAAAGEEPRTRIAVREVTKTYVRKNGEAVKAIDGINLDVAAGEFLVLLGPSGCGKTTLLRVLAGLESIEHGQVEIDGRLVEDHARRLRIPAERRGLSMMFQSYALWPHMTVAENVAYPLSTRHVARRERAKLVSDVLTAVGIPGLAEQYPSQLSGGQQQRVALARAVVAGDGIVLFDEPLSNVDAKVRDKLRGEIQRLHREFGFTAVYVTHDQEEAMMLGTRIVVLREGTIAQAGTAEEIYNEPVDVYIARFMGGTNELLGSVTKVRDGLVEVDTPAGRITGRGVGALAPGDTAIAFSRPERWHLADTGGAGPDDGESSWCQGRVVDRTYLGQYTDLTIQVDAALEPTGDSGDPGDPSDSARLRVRTMTNTASVGQEAGLWIAPDDVLIYRAES
jgi:iron(III) transport system ATP-binding protein